MAVATAGLLSLAVAMGVGRFAFTGRALNRAQTVVFRIRFEPVRTTGTTR